MAACNAPEPMTAIDSTPTQCRLLSLPAELRNHIWSYLLVQDTESPSHTYSPKSETCIVKCRDKPSYSQLLPGCSRRVCVSVLQTCRQVHTEGTPILYGANVFIAHISLLNALPALALQTFPSREIARPVTSTLAASRIRRFRMLVRLDVDARFTASQAAAAFSGLDELELDVFQSSYLACTLEVLTLFEDVRGVGRAIVEGSVGDGKYASWLVDLMQSCSGTVWPPFRPGIAGYGDARTWDAWTHGNR